MASNGSPPGGTASGNKPRLSWIRPKSLVARQCRVHAESAAETVAESAKQRAVVTADIQHARAGRDVPDGFGNAPVLQEAVNRGHGKLVARVPPRALCVDTKLTARAERRALPRFRSSRNFPFIFAGMATRTFIWSLAPGGVRDLVRKPRTLMKKLEKIAWIPQHDERGRTESTRRKFSADVRSGPNPASFHIHTARRDKAMSRHQHERGRDRCLFPV